jgi:hypothetical protein
MTTPLTLTAATPVPEWAMTTEQWVAHQERLHGPNWREVFDRADEEAADAAFFGCVGDVPFDAAPDLTADRARRAA